MTRLTAMRVRNLKKAGRHSDGGGLSLLVRPNGNRSWVLRMQHEGRRRDFGLGSAESVSLADARSQAVAMRALIKSGVDPVAEKKRRQTIPTFRDAALEVIHEKQSGWRNPKSRAQWLHSLEAYVFPSIGTIKISNITAGHVRDVLISIWLEKPETARRIKQRIGNILDWAYSKGYRETEAPMRAIVKGLPPQQAKSIHFKALDYLEAPAFMEKLAAGQPTTGRQALQFLILTGARSGEVRYAKWSDVDLEKSLWTTPAERMKNSVEHVVPLSAAALSILSKRWEHRTSNRPLIFEGMRPGRPLSATTLTKVLRDMGLDVTAHGFRSTFRDWTAETTATPNEVAEMALAHGIKNKAEAAYRRGNLLQKRRDLMDAWANYILPGAMPSKVIKLAINQ